MLLWLYTTFKLVKKMIYIHSTCTIFNNKFWKRLFLVLRIILIAQRELINEFRLLQLTQDEHLVH